MPDQVLPPNAPSSVTSPPVTNAPRTPAVAAPTPTLEIQARIVNGILVVLVIAIVGTVYLLQTKDAAAYGAFTTLVGTALSAYFGISATREVSRNAVDSANTQNADARQQLGQLQERHHNVNAKLDAARNLVAPSASNPSDSTMTQLRSILSA